MAAFDPDAATAAYLAQLPPAAHVRAAAYTHGQHWLLLWGWLVTVVAAVLILKSAVLPRVQAWLERKKGRPLIVAFLLSAVFLCLDFVLELPWQSYADWWRETSYGLNNQTWPDWFGELALQSAISLPFVALFLTVIYWAMRRAPRSWPVWAAVIAAVFVLFTDWISPVFVEPLFNTFTPAPPGPVRELVVQLGQANGVPTDKIYIFNGSKQSDRYTANVSGLFGTARVALSDTMFKKGADLAEVKGVVGHEMGHYVHQHGLWDAAFDGVMVLIGGLLLQRLFPLVLGWLQAPWITGLADPAGLPILMLIVATLSLFATPITNSFSRWAEADADSFSLERAREPDGLAKALVKTIEYRAATPTRLEEIVFYDHPSVYSRVRKAMNWKAAHLNEAPAPSAAAAGSGPTPAGR